MQPQAGSDQLFQDVDDGRAADDLVKDRMNLVRGLDPPHPRVFAGVAGFQIVDIGMLGDFGCAGDKFGDDLTHLGERSAIQHFRHHDHAIAAVGLDILVRNHCKSSAGRRSRLTALSFGMLALSLCLRKCFDVCGFGHADSQLSDDSP